MCAQTVRLLAQLIAEGVLGLAGVSRYLGNPYSGKTNLPEKEAPHPVNGTNCWTGGHSGGTAAGGLALRSKPAILKSWKPSSLRKKTLNP